MVRCKWCNKNITEKKDNFANFCDRKCNKRFNYYNNQERYIQQSKDWASKNKEHVKEYKKGLYENKHVPKRVKIFGEQKQIIDRLRKESRKIWGRGYSKLERVNNYKKSYRRRPEVKMKQRERWKSWAKKNEEQVNIRLRIHQHLRKAIKRYIEKGIMIKQKKPIELSFTIIAKNLLINLPNDYNKIKYHIDHIKPICSFDLTDEKQLKEAYSVENLRWLPAEENLKKITKDKEMSIWKK